MSKGPKEKPITATEMRRKPRLTTGERFKDARTVHNQHGKETTGSVEEATGVSKSTISEIENDNRDPGARIVSALARHYGVSSDYLLGLSDVVTPDITAQGVIAYTGLSEENVITLHNAAQHSVGVTVSTADNEVTQLNGDKPFLDCLNDLLDAVFYDRETLIKHYIRMRRSTLKPSAFDLWYLSGLEAPIPGFEPRRYDNLTSQAKIDNEMVEYDCLKIAKEIERFLKQKYVATQEEIDHLWEDI